MRPHAVIELTHRDRDLLTRLDRRLRQRDDIGIHRDGDLCHGLGRRRISGGVPRHDPDAVRSLLRERVGADSTREHDEAVRGGREDGDQGEGEGERANRPDERKEQQERRGGGESPEQESAESDDLRDREDLLDAEERGPGQDGRQDREQHCDEDPEQSQHARDSMTAPWEDPARTAGHEPRYARRWSGDRRFEGPSDLHLHSVHSDGTESPSEVMAAAHRQGLRTVSLTDHDTTSGWSEAAEAAGRSA